jgi:hypothetical protein
VNIALLEEQVGDARAQRLHLPFGQVLAFPDLLVSSCSVRLRVRWARARADIADRADGVGRSERVMILALRSAAATPTRARAHLGARTCSIHASGSYGTVAVIAVYRSTGREHKSRSEGGRLSYSTKPE